MAAPPDKRGNSMPLPAGPWPGTGQWTHEARETVIQRRDPTNEQDEEGLARGQGVDAEQLQRPRMQVRQAACVDVL